MSAAIGLEVVKGVVLLRGVPAVYLRKENAIVVADIHLGYEESMARQGVFLPRMQARKALRILREARRVTGATKLFVDGDIKHEFGRLLKSEKLEVARLLKGVFDAGYREVVVVRGNHDNYIRPVIESLGGEMAEDLSLGEITLTHGHKKISEAPGLIVIGHEHPSVSLSISGVKARFPAFLLVPLVDSESTVLVLPALGAYQTGNPVGLDRRAYLSPLIREKGDVGEAVPIIVDETEGLMPLPKLSLLAGLVL